MISLLKKNLSNVLNAYKDGKSIVELIVSGSEPICERRNVDAKKVRILGSGISGVAFEVSIDGKIYVLKEETIEKKRSECWRAKYTMKGCDTNSIYSFNIQDYSCDKYYSEYLISSLCGSLKRNLQSINFIDVFGAAICKKSLGSGEQFLTFMEKISGDMHNVAQCIYQLEEYSDIFVGNLILQILHSIHLIQTKFGVVHGDMHIRNVFVEYIDEKTMWNNQTLIDADYFEYRVNGKSLYIPWCPFIVKIGDFGLASKYISPQIFNNELLKIDCTIPNWFSPCYDYLTIFPQLYTIHKVLKLKPLIYEALGSDPEILGKNNFVEGKISINSLYNDLKRWNDYGRPIPKFSLNFKKTPADLLLGKTCSKYQTKPPNGSKVVLLGTDE